MKISVRFIKIHQAVYGISALTFLPLEALIFITKTKKVLDIIISSEGYIDKENMHCYGFENKEFFFFTHNGEKKTKRKSLQLMTEIFGGPPF